MENFVPFFIILVAGVLFSTVFNRIHVPWVIALIISGIVVGPNVLGVIEINDTFAFLSQAGLVFLMFMAGLETKLTNLKEVGKHTLPLAFVNGFLPFLAGASIGVLFGYSTIVSFLIGIIFVSSSIAIVVPALESTKLLKTPLGQAVMTSNIFLDVVSLILLSIFLQSSRPVANIPLFIFYPILFLCIGGILYLLPRIEKFIAGSAKGLDDFQREIRAIFVVLFGAVIIFEILGLHSIIAAFLAGLVLSKTVTSAEVTGKLRAISYGIFVPTFFVLVGVNTDISVFANFATTGILTLAIVFASMFSKIVSGYLGARLVRFTPRQSVLFAVSSVPQLSTTLAATFAARSYGLIDQELFASLVILSVVTTLVGPFLMSYFSEKLDVKTSL